MEKLIEILEEIQPDVEYETCTDLVDAHRIDSLAILSIVSEIEDAFDITVPTVEIIPANFNSAQSLWNMILRLQEDE